jgi:hypothetical protein
MAYILLEIVKYSIGMLNSAFFRLTKSFSGKMVYDLQLSVPNSILVNLLDLYQILLMYTIPVFLSLSFPKDFKAFQEFRI